LQNGYVPGSSGGAQAEKPAVPRINLRGAFRSFSDGGIFDACVHFPGSTMTDEVAPAARILTRNDGATIAYRHTAGRMPGVVFLIGLRSNMNSAKALYVEEHCRHQNRAFVRFDYFAHGESSGDFLEATVGRWVQDALTVIDELTEGPQVLVGSSIGGWIMTLAALARPHRIAGLIGIAAAPDSTTELIPGRLTDDMKAELSRNGIVYKPSTYDTDPYPITQRMIDDGDQHLVLRAPIPLHCPVRLIHGTADPDVPWQHSVKLAETLRSADVELLLVKNGDHRLSKPADLARLGRVLNDLFDVIEAD
jgi:pimeloyl-ACP methyl ester carboxylesterase